MESIEKSPEQIPTKEMILEIIGKYVENAQVTREISDDKGLFMIEAKADGENPGDVNEYEYMRKGRIQGHDGGTLVSSIEVVYYTDGMPVSGETIASYDHETGEWKFFKQTH